MVKVKEVVGFLNRELDTSKLKDYSKNGLQVKGRKEIKNVGFAVDANLPTFKKASREKVDLLVVHHGIKWKLDKERKVNKLRAEAVKKTGMSLYAVHLPLDAHYKYGNNIGLCELLRLGKRRKFGRYGSSKVGYKGEFANVKSLSWIKRVLDKELGADCKIYNFGKKKIKTIGVVSGGAGEFIGEAVKEGLDCFIVGEIKLGDYNRARDLGLSLIVGGHYATETVGVKILQKLVKEKFGVKTKFIKVDTPI
ncbi:Nif3-like dinuclear metal center hexameric protein [Candidatus Woesearchaeota archaeon]|jgi:dinuclear metal center YbgI/SA1388 family protein|nr:Nif3-like dinuclear metal center hexameric protein [Candidatus Woesearchaeota archaeon]